MSLKLKTDDQCKIAYEEIKFKKSDARFVIYKVDRTGLETIVAHLLEF